MILEIAMLALISITDADKAFLARVENHDSIVNRKPIKRVERDVDGNVVLLRLDEMRLSGDEFACVSRLSSLRYLSLRGTNVTDSDLKQLHGLKNLLILVLSATNITDAAIGELDQFPSLKTLCMGDVAVSPDAVAKMKKRFREQHRDLSLGYYQRKSKP